MGDITPSSQLTNAASLNTVLRVPLGFEANTGVSVLRASGFFGASWPSRSGSVIPQGLGGGGWTLDPTTPNTYDRGYPQQTFLGASIRSFSMNGGFGDNSATLSVELVNDEFNVSDRTSQGLGDDVYHSGTNDRFVPPIAGTPVYFKFGPNWATVEQAYRKTFDDLYGYNTLGAWTAIPSAGSFNKDNFTSLAAHNYVNLGNNTIYNFQDRNTNTLTRGSGHIVFGGILQSYTQNRGPGGNPLYSVQVVDPREILSNVVVLLNNYAGTTFNTQNIFNVYGFLEHNMTVTLSGQLQGYFGGYNLLRKYVNQTNGYITYSGSRSTTEPLDCWVGGNQSLAAFGGQRQFFPVTGTGFSRRGPQGIPYYRVAQAITALMGVQYSVPQEYANRGLGKTINFRGYNYVVDFSGLPTLPPMYFLDFDQINLLDLAMEICDVASRDLYVSLLPVINHPACQFLYNNQNASGPIPSGLIAGIIRLDSIDRSKVPAYGSIKKYIDSLATSGIFVENQDVGYELSNVTTDKFVVGAQEVDMYYFSANADKDMIGARQQSTVDNYSQASWQQWTLEKQLEQQILPYYGTLGQNAVTIPKGWGAYQQILLDTTGLNANGVGAYYVATEMELRCASVSYECWKSFLQQYNDIYLESVEGNDAYEGAVLNQTANFGGVPAVPTGFGISNNYAVTVPRSVFETFAPDSGIWGPDKLPSSPCNPPYGYPLYYKRMSKLGIPEGGLTRIQGKITSMIAGAAAIRGADGENYEEIRNAQLSEMEAIREQYGYLSPVESGYYQAIKQALASTPPTVNLLNDIENSLHSINAVLPRLAKKGTENALKVYEFLKKVADENLGKKFLVKIPNKVNLFYENSISWKNQTTGEYYTGPFGFKPRPSTSGIGDEFSSTFLAQYRGDRDGSKNMIRYFLASGIDAKQAKYNGALRANFNPIIDKYEFNYTPSTLGGYFPFDLYSNTLSLSQMMRLPENLRPSGVINNLIPQDLTNFLDENGRISAYARFDNSQHLAFGSMNSEDFTQQLVTSQGMVPDLCEFLDNLGDDRLTETFSDADNSRRDNDANAPKQCAFVKCTVDDKFYMPPKIVNSGGMKVYGACGPTDYRTKTVMPRKIFIPCKQWRDGVVGTSQDDLVDGTGVYVDSFRYTEREYFPTTGVSTTTTRYVFDRRPDVFLNSYIIKTDLQDLDTRNVYALITLPNKVIPTKDARYRDAINQKDNGKDVKHYLTVDVVKGLPEFTTPGYAKASTTSIIANDPLCKLFTPEARSVAWLASKKARSALQFGLPQQIQMSAPSPVSPDLVALPLISNERCYGPWVSSQLDVQSQMYSNIGGRIEFIKDENLSPWNYAGYELLNEAGILQAQFTNSLLLFSERGGFTYPGIPTTSLCQVLLSGGPLVTNISVDVGEGGIRTTYKMDLYTASFGKLQKQKQDMISKISRERQRLRDERNALIRKGIGKAQTSINIAGNSDFLLGNNGTVPPLSRPTNHIVASVHQYETKSYSSVLAGGGGGLSRGMFGDASPAGMVDQVDSVYAASMQSEQDIFDTINKFDRNTEREVAQYNAGSISMSDMYIPYSNEPYHPNMPNVKYVDYKATNRLYESEEDNIQINDDNISFPA